MRCPFCGSDDTQVKDSRPTEENAAIRRRRVCPGCGGRFTRRSGSVVVIRNIIAAMVLQFGYLGVMGDIVLKTSPLGPQLKRLPIRLSAHDNLRVGVVTLRNRTLSPATQLFIETAREVVADLAQA